MGEQWYVFLELLCLKLQFVKNVLRAKSRGSHCQFSLFRKFVLSCVAEIADKRLYRVDQHEGTGGQEPGPHRKGQ